MADFESRRQANIRRNKDLLGQIKPLVPKTEDELSKPNPGRRSVKRKADPLLPQRQSRRIAEATKNIPIDYDENSNPTGPRTAPRNKASRKAAVNIKTSQPASSPTPEPPRDTQSIIAGWTAWEPEAEEPVRDTYGTFHFDSHPDFQPNKSPEEIIKEGCFGGSYWRPLYSKRLRITVADDWKELPTAWIAGLDTARYLTSTTYDPEINKYGVACGQSIEEWEAAGWIAHEYDVRGWFQWYCRFWMGRRCPDDERQISRWKRCVGETGRWRRTLLKKYVALGIQSVFADDGEDDDRGEVSPVVHQTCHHWAYEVRQEALERFRANGR